MRVVFKCPVYVVVVGDEVTRVVAARDCAEGPIVAECAGCGANDVDGDAAAVAAASVADCSPWPGPLELVAGMVSRRSAPNHARRTARFD